MPFIVKLWQLGFSLLGLTLVLTGYALIKRRHGTTGMIFVLFGMLAVGIGLGMNVVRFL